MDAPAISVMGVPSGLLAGAPTIVPAAAAPRTRSMVWLLDASPSLSVAVTEIVYAPAADGVNAKFWSDPLATTMPASAMMLTSGALNAESDHTARHR